MVAPLGTQFPMEGMEGRSSLLNETGYERLLNAARQAEQRLAPDFRANVRSALPPGTTIRSAASKAAGNVAGKYIPILGAGLSLMQGDFGGALGGVGGTVLGAPFGPLGSLAGSVVLGSIGSAAQKGIGGLIQGALGGAAANTAARGESAGPIPGLPGIGAKKVGDMNVNETIDFMRRAGMNQVDIAKALNPMLNQNLDQQRNRQMQMNQQTAQLTGALNQQRYMAELAGGAQTEAGALTRQVITSVNPYANSAFQYR
jgi:hypothetical protein